MQGTDLAGLAAADAILSIVPPAEAVAFAQTVAPALRAVSNPAVFVDCNALDVRTVQAIGTTILDAGARFVDAGIIGFPPKPGGAGPVFYLSGPEAEIVAGIIGPLGLQAKAMDGPVGAASALKMSYAGITKGLAAIASIMILGAERAGAGAALREELLASQPQLLARFSTSLPDMLPKAYRWVAEMREIASFLGEDADGQAVFEGIARFYERIAADVEGQRLEAGVIETFAKTARND